MNYNELIKEKFIKVLEYKKEQCEAKIKDLMNANTTDEANLEKIKLNVYDIFCTLFNASYKKAYSNENISTEEAYEKLQETYLGYFNKIPAPWREKYQKAKEMDLVLDCVREEIKLETVDEIKEIFKKISIEVKNKD